MALSASATRRHWTPTQPRPRASGSAFSHQLAACLSSARGLRHTRSLGGHGGGLTELPCVGSFPWPGGQSPTAAPVPWPRPRSGPFNAPSSPVGAGRLGGAATRSNARRRRELVPCGERGRLRGAWQAVSGGQPAIAGPAARVRAWQARGARDSPLQHTHNAARVPPADC